MEHLDGILRLVERELEAVEQNGKFRSREEVDSVYKLVDIVKDIYCISDMENGDGGMAYDNSYESYEGDSRSYARGRGRGAKRDSMGRYSRDGSYRGYSGYGGYSGRSYRGYSRGDKQEYIEQLRGMMEDAPDDKTRQSIERMISQMEQG